MSSLYTLSHLKRIENNNRNWDFQESGNVFEFLESSSRLKL